MRHVLIRSPLSPSRACQPECGRPAWPSFKLAAAGPGGSAHNQQRIPISLTQCVRHRVIESESAMRRPGPGRFKLLKLPANRARRRLRDGPDTARRLTGSPPDPSPPAGRGSTAQCQHCGADGPPAAQLRLRPGRIVAGAVTVLHRSLAALPE
jgi:hypothetical protein